MTIKTRYIYILCAILLGTTVGMARAVSWESPAAAPAPKKMISSAAFFPLHRQVMVRSDNPQMTLEVQRRLGAEGMTVNNAFYRFLGPSIVLRKCSKIENLTERNDALKIQVKGSKILVLYTSTHSCYRALSMLEGLIVTHGGRKVVSGGEYWDWDGVIRSSRARTIDAASRYMSRDEIESTIHRMSSMNIFRSNHMMLEVANKDYWRLGVSTFSIVNPEQSIFPSREQYYTFENINQLIAAARKDKVTLVPVIDVLSENRPFAQVTGHAPSSVEGMRFVRHVIEEYARNVRTKKICLGPTDNNPDKRFMEFLEQIVRDNGLELVSL